MLDTFTTHQCGSIGYGSSDRFQDGIVHIAVYTKHVNLGFNHGATLEDPLGILKGTGKHIRHITIKTLKDLARPEIRAYVRRAHQTASDDARKLGDEPGDKLKRVVTGEAIYQRTTSEFDVNMPWGAINSTAVAPVDRETYETK